MATNIDAAVSTWNDARQTAVSELEALEATLKTAYNGYVDALAAYLERLQTANDIRTGYVNVLNHEDVENDTRLASSFVHLAEAPIENNAPKYVLDSNIPQQVKSTVLVHAVDYEKLLERKAP